MRCCGSGERKRNFKQSPKSLSRRFSALFVLNFVNNASFRKQLTRNLNFESRTSQLISAEGRRGTQKRKENQIKESPEINRENESAQKTTLNTKKQMKRKIQVVGYRAQNHTHNHTWHGGCLGARTNLALGPVDVRLGWGTGPTAFKNMPARNGRIIPGSLLMNPIRQSLEEARTLAPYHPLQYPRLPSTSTLLLLFYSQI